MVGIGNRQGWSLRMLLFAAALLAVASGAVHGDTIYVDASATGNDDGTTWQHAFTSLQSALSNAISGDEIWVVAGSYKPTAQSCIACGTPGARHETFLLPTGVRIFGGFAGGESSLAERDPEVNQTILSGDIGTVDDPNDNAYHVVTAYHVSVGTVLSGFTITGGNADDANPGGSIEAFGGGVLIVGDAVTASSPQITRCRIIGNTALGGGAGAFVTGRDGDPVRIVNCEFAGNIVENGVGAGVAIGGSYPSVPVHLTNCVLYGNAATGNTAGVK